MTGNATGTQPKATMKTIDKALNLLGYFLPETPQWKLSDLARAAGMDKVTTMRILNSLASRGFVEQHPETRKYRLGSAVLHLARVREACFPIAEILQPIVDRLAVETGETAHACIFSGSAMTTVAVAEPYRATRVTVDPSQLLPVYASASGIAYLAHSDEATRRGVLEDITLRAHASGTPKDIAELRARLEEAAAKGHALAAQTFEDEVTGIAVPVFDWRGNACATIAAACVANRLDEVETQRILRAVRNSASEATRAMGGEPGHVGSGPRGEARA